MVFLNSGALLDTDDHIINLNANYFYLRVWHHRTDDLSYPCTCCVNRLQTLDSEGTIRNEMRTILILMPKHQV